MRYYRRYYCINCGSVFEPSLKAEFDHIKVRCSFCHYEAVLIPIPDIETVSALERRTGREYPGSAPVYHKPSLGDHGYYPWFCGAKERSTFNDPPGWDSCMVIATEAGAPPDDWRPE